jgi:hypothetical protein
MHAVWAASFFVRFVRSLGRKNIIPVRVPNIKHPLFNGKTLSKRKKEIFMKLKITFFLYLYSWIRVRVQPQAGNGGRPAQGQPLEPTLYHQPEPLEPTLYHQSELVVAILYHQSERLVSTMHQPDHVVSWRSGPSRRDSQSDAHMEISSCSRFMTFNYAFWLERGHTR